MSLLQLNSYRRILLKIIIEEIFHEYSSVRIRRNGFIILRRRKFSFRREKIHAYELCVNALPQRFIMLVQKYNTGAYSNYLTRFRSELTKILSGESYENLVDFYFSEFNKFRWDIAKVEQKAVSCSRLVQYKDFVTEKIANLIPPNLSYMTGLNTFLWEIDTFFKMHHPKITNMTNLDNVIKFFWPSLRIRTLTAA